MKNTVILFASAVLALSVGSASARCVGPVVNGSCLGAEVYGSDSDSGSGGYSGHSGNRYQYDLSKPGDRIRYSTDLSAQGRDSRSLNLRRSLDRGLGQYGGGIYDD